MLFNPLKLKGTFLDAVTLYLTGFYVLTGSAGEGLLMLGFTKLYKNCHKIWISTYKVNENSQNKSKWE